MATDEQKQVYAQLRTMVSDQMKVTINYNGQTFIVKPVQNFEYELTINHTQIETYQSYVEIYHRIVG